jgi:hypothetical protein
LEDFVTTMAEEEIKIVPTMVATGVVETASDDEKHGVVEVADLSEDIDSEIEKRILRKFDRHIIPLLTFMYFCS